MKAIVIQKHGTVQELQYQEKPIPLITPSQILVRLTHIGVNFIDIYEREGVYPLSLPYIPGKEGVGIIEEIGSKVTGWSVGQRVGFAFAPHGAYADYIALEATQAIAIPHALSSSAAAAVLLQGLTADFLTRDTFPLGPQHTMLIHAAAGGVGLLAIQMAKALGAKVIGTASTPEKIEAARQAGADLVMNYEDEIISQTMEFTKDQGVDVVYDSVGKATFSASLEMLKNRGLMVSFGQSSGLIPDINLNETLSRRAHPKGSFYITRPTLKHYIPNQEVLKERSNRVFSALERQELKAFIHHVYPLEEAAQAQKILETRQTIGKVLLSTR